MTRVAIVVLNWNGFEDTRRCLDSLFEQSYGDFSILLVENGSHDDSKEQIQQLAESKQDERLHVIYNQKNLGFAGGVNVGIRYALERDYDAIALFNNDAVADTEWLSSLVSALDEPQVGIATGLLLHEDGVTIDSTGDYYSSWGMPFPRGRDTPAAAAPASGFVFGASGGASIFTRELFETIGVFDETFFAYYEDVDVSFRAQLAGFTVRYTKKAIAYHKQGASSDKIPGFTVYQTFKNIPLLFIKNVPLRLLVPIGVRLWVVYVLVFLNAIKNGAGWYALKGWIASISLTFTSALWKRRKIQRTATVSSQYINSILWHDLPPNQTGVRKLFRKS